MPTSSVESASLDNIRANYQPYQTQEETSGNELGTEAFLTLLVAQLENQNPLDPVDSSEWTNQLAQYSELEQLINLNDKADIMMAQAAEDDSTINAADYVGREVTGEAGAMTITEGSVTPGFYNLSEPGQVQVVIQDANGNVVNTMDLGHQESGGHLVTWDGTDDAGQALADGNYTYTVMANTGSGYETITSNITGTVDSVVTLNGKQFLNVGGVLLDPEAVTNVSESSESGGTGSTTSIMDYLGATITSDYPIVQVEGSEVKGGALTFNLESSQDVVVNIYDANDNLISSSAIPADQTQAGENQVVWDASSDAGTTAPDGLYYYTVQTDDGYASTEVEGEVSWIRNINGTQYLELAESGRLVSVSTVTGIH